MSLLPSRGPDASASQDGELEVVGVDEDVSAVLDALSSDTARQILNTVYDDPGTPSELADRLGMSIQKVSYHLEKLEDEELITVAGTRYSEKGQEMKVYEPPEDPLVLFVGTRERKRSLRSLVKRLVPVVGLLTAASFVVELVLGNVPLPIGTTGSADGGEFQDGAEVATEEAATPGAETPASTATQQDTNITIRSNETGGASQYEAETTGSDGGGVGIAEVNKTASPEPAATGEPAATQTPAATPEPATTGTPADIDMATEVATVAASDPGPALVLSPGLAFFLGGLLVVCLVSLAWFYDGR